MSAHATTTAPETVITVIVWGNLTVMVFDPDGVQMPHYQGTLPRVRATLAALVPVEGWHYDLYPGNTPGNAEPDWVIGRAGELERYYRRQQAMSGILTAPLATVMAELEARQGRLLGPPCFPQRHDRKE